tara:strand:- start:38 stop:349 length:312 start_codon:yes stop_codon:yes gene_type:complete
MSNNIILFPSNENVEVEEVVGITDKDKFEQALAVHIVNVSLDITADLYSKLDYHVRGEFKIVNGEVEGDLNLIYEAVKSAVSKLYGVEHSLQDLACDPDFTEV